jgi:hypothetical protein
MKLLLENWNKYLVNEGYDEPMTATQKANYNFLMEQAEENVIFAKLLEDIILVRVNLFRRRRVSVEPENLTEDLIEKFVREVPTFGKELISSIAGTGTQGIAFRLKNGNVLKIYAGGYLDSTLDGKEEEEFYASEKSKMFSGDGSVSTLPVYDQGTVDLFGNKIRYTEMAQVMPFEDYLQFTGRWDTTSIDSINSAINSLRRLFIALEIENSTLDQMKYRVDRTIKLIRKSNLTGPEVRGIAIMLKYVLSKYGKDYLRDFHYGNFGVLQQTIATNKPAFVLFDP